MRRVPVYLLALVLCGAASAAPPTVSVSASAGLGSVPLTVTFTAAGDASSYRWSFGDGGSAEGAVVSHTYTRPGVYVSAVDATSSEGETTRAQVTVTAVALELSAPRVADYGEPVRFHGRLAPVLPGARVTLLRGTTPVATASPGRAGRVRFRTRVRTPAPYRLRFRGILSSPRPIGVVPRLEARLIGSGFVGGPLRLVARVAPAGAGRVRIRIGRNGRDGSVRLYRRPVPVYTGRPDHIRVALRLSPAAGFSPAGAVIRRRLVQPALRLGSQGVAVRVLEGRLAALRYALERVDSTYGRDTYEGVLAFQKAEGLPWTGRVDRRVWRALARARTPRPRYRGDHLEVSKSRQLLLVVRSGRVDRVVHTSTGATGNTPVGRWQVYRKVVGWDWVLWYPMYFLRGFAIHGYPSVPAYPASHGCVRVPMWIAPVLHARHPGGTTVHVYW